MMHGDPRERHPEKVRLARKEVEKILTELINNRMRMSTLNENRLLATMNCIPWIVSMIHMRCTRTQLVEVTYTVAELCKIPYADLWMMVATVYTQPDSLQCLGEIEDSGA